MRALWSHRPNCSHNVSQKVRRIKRFSDQEFIYHPRGKVAILIFRKLNLLCICNEILVPPSPQLDLRQIEHQSMETARYHICIDHVILIVLGQALNLHLPLQCNSEIATRKS